MPNATNNYPPAVAKFLRAPRLPRRSPVVIAHVRNESNPNERVWKVCDLRGSLLETVHDTAGNELQLRERYPWFGHRDTTDGIPSSYGPGLVRSWEVMTSWAKHGRVKRMVAHGEYILRSELEPSQRRILENADRCTAWARLRDALSSITTAASSTHQSYAVIYHRDSATGGTYVRRALAAMVRAGMLEAVWLDSNGDSGQYRATDTTPYIR